MVKKQPLFLLIATGRQFVAIAVAVVAVAANAFVDGSGVRLVVQSLIEVRLSSS